MADFGYKIKGETLGMAMNMLLATKFTCPNAGVGESMTMYVKDQSEPAMSLAIYDDYEGYPGNLIGYTVEWTVPGGYDNWKTLDFASGHKPTFVAGGIYHLVWNADAWVYQYSVTPGEPNQYTYKDSDYSYPFPDPFPAGGTQVALKISIYCTYILEVVEQTVELAPHESKMVSFKAVPHKVGVYGVRVNGLTGTFTAIE